MLKDTNFYLDCFRITMLAIGAAILGGVVVGSAVGIVIGGTIIAIKSLMNEHRENMQRIINKRNEIIRKAQNERNKQIYRESEFRQVFKLFQLEVEQARKIIEEAEYTDDNGKKIKGYEGRLDWANANQFSVHRH